MHSVPGCMERRCSVLGTLIYQPPWHLRSKDSLINGTRVREHEASDETVLANTKKER
jgi:hypothetical protein